MHDAAHKPLPIQGADPLGSGGRWLKSTKDKYAEQPLAVTPITTPGFEVRVRCLDATIDHV